VAFAGREDLWEDDCQTHVAAANGGAAAAYLQWIVSHYYQLPSAVAFIHDHGCGIPRDNYAMWLRTVP
jgi:hypothetical protein